MSDPLPPPPPGPPASAPPPPPYAAPPASPYQQGMNPPPGTGSPGYMPAPITPTAGGINLGAQFLGARSSIVVGLIGIVVPIVSAMVLGGTVFYFYVLPIFGVIYGVRSIMRGYVIGGIAGVVLNLVAGLVSLTAAGLVNPGG